MPKHQKLSCSKHIPNLHNSRDSVSLQVPSEPRAGRVPPTIRQTWRDQSVASPLAWQGWNLVRGALGRNLLCLASSYICSTSFMSHLEASRVKLIHADSDWHGTWLESIQMHWLEVWLIYKVPAISSSRRCDPKDVTYALHAALWSARHGVAWYIEWHSAHPETTPHLLPSWGVASRWWSWVSSERTIQTIRCGWDAVYKCAVDSSAK